MTGDPLRVLVVDDQQDSAEMLSMLLEDRGHVTCVAVDGPSALTLAEAFQPHVGLLDLGLPGMSGFELAMRLRAVPGLERAAPGGGDRSRQRCRARERRAPSGFDEHFLKPVDLRALISLLEAARLALSGPPEAQTSDVAAS